MASSSTTGFEIQTRDIRLKKTIPFGAAHTYKAYIREYPPPPSPVYRFCIPVSVSGTWIPDSFSCILDFKAQDSKFNNLNSRFLKQKFPGFRNPLRGRNPD